MVCLSQRNTINHKWQWSVLACALHSHQRWVHSKENFWASNATPSTLHCAAAARQGWDLSVFACLIVSPLYCSCRSDKSAGAQWRKGCDEAPLTPRKGCLLRRGWRQMRVLLKGFRNAKASFSVLFTVARWQSAFGWTMVLVHILCMVIYWWEGPHKNSFVCMQSKRFQMPYVPH